MTAVLMIGRAELRRAWRSFVALGVLAGITGGVALAAVQVARRTSTAFERLEVAAGVPDVAVIDSVGDGTALATLPGVESAWILRQAVAKVEGDSLVYTGVLAAEQPAPAGLFHPPLAEGRAPNPEAADEVVVSQNFRSISGRVVGDTLDLALLTADEVHQFDTGFGEPDGPKITVKIVGVLRTALDTGTNTPQMYGTPALARLIAPDATAATAVFVRLDDRVAGVPAFRTAVDGLPVPPAAPAGEQEFAPYQVLVPSAQRSVVAVTARVLVTGLLVFAAIAALAGLLGVALALRRQILSRSVDPATMRALGADGRQIRFARIFAMIPFVGAGLLAAVLVVLLASGVNPIGSLGRREPYPGWHLNVALMVTGLAVLALVLALIAVVATRRRAAVRRHRRNGGLARLTAGAPPVVEVGAKFGLATGGGRNPVPVRSALVGTVIAIIGVVAVTVYAMSLTRTVEDPTRWGWVVDAQVVDTKPAEFDRLVADQRLESVTRLDESSVVLSGSSTNAMAFTPLRGLRTWTLLDGRLPERSGEVLLGARLRDNLDTGIGRIVTFEKNGKKLPYRVVGVGTGPNTSNNQFAIDVVVTPDALTEIQVTEPFTAAAIVVAPGNDPDTVLADYARTLELSSPTRPADVDNLAQLGALPELLIAFLAFVAIAVLAHLLTTLTRRRRAELDVLAAIGFLPRQVRRVVYVAALAMVGVGLLVGVPLGLVAGRIGWRITADAIYVPAAIASPLVALLILAASACAVALLVAAVPAWRVTRNAIADGLRDE
jgi:ABC-type antimicrobial peptide transport system permease subunit